MKINKRTYIFLFLIAILVNFVVSRLIREPGYMDAEYYFAGAQRIASGTGNSEPFIWNYLSSPQAIPVPSFSYWMPLTAIISSIGMLVSGSKQFPAAQTVMVLISGFIPVITMLLASKITDNKPGVILAGIFSIFSVFYQPYISNTDSFVLFIVLGGLCLLALRKVFQEEAKWIHFLSVGLITGLLHLCRADGLLIFVFILAIVFFWKLISIRHKPFRWRTLLDFAMLIFGYIAVMGVWYARNLAEFQSLMPSGNGLLLFSTNYNDIFKANLAQLSFDRFWDQGILQIFTIRLNAFWLNLKSILAVNGSLFLGPLMIVGMWKNRKNNITKLTAGLITLNLVTMSILFPFAGYRGGFFHSNSLTQTALWAFASMGLIAFLEFAVRIRKWHFQQSWRIFSSALVAGLILLSAFMVYQRINPESSEEVRWNGRFGGFIQLNELILTKTGDKTSPIMVNDPPGFYLATGRSSVVVPTDSLDTVFQVARKFDVRFLILDKNNLTINHELAQNDYANDRLNRIEESGGTIIYEFIAE